MADYSGMGALLGVAAVLSMPAMADVVGGGSTMTQGLYTTPGVLGAGFAAYAGVGSGKGKSAFLTNNAADINRSGVTVDYAASDSILTAAELANYQVLHNSAHNSAQDQWGPLIQIPSAITTVTIPYTLRLANGTAVTDLNLTSEQLCAIFSGAVSQWNMLDTRYPPTAIKVFYRSANSGPSELLSRHLNSRCPAQFSVNSNFTVARQDKQTTHLTGVASDAAMLASVAAIDGAIGYAGPEDLGVISNAKVARVNGLLPPTGPVTTPLANTLPPVSAADRLDPSKWAPVLADPPSGYAMVGYTYLLFGQCYRDAEDAANIRAFLTRHYGLVANNDAAIIARNMIPLSNLWKNHIRLPFTQSSATMHYNINNPDVCNAQGRPS